MHILGELLSTLLLPIPNPLQVHHSDQSYKATCDTIGRSISLASNVYYPGSPNFQNATNHWLPSSSQDSTCAVEPGTVRDVSTIVQILGDTETPFAIRSGGRATTLGFSSTLGVAINLVRLDSVTYDPVSNTATIGTGQSWDQVYRKLEPYGVSVAGGRIFGVGVAGLALGGGYSWMSNRYGMTIDTITAFELVLPNATVIDVTATSAPELFFGLKGGYNNFGLVTKITMQAFKQGLVWGGTINYAGDNVKAAATAVAKFSATNTNLDANCVLNIFHQNGVPGATLILIYNGPKPPAGLFSDFLVIPESSKSVKTRTFWNFVVGASDNYNNDKGLRGTFSAVSIPNITAPVVDEILEQIEYYSTPGVYSDTPSASCTISTFYGESIIRPRDVSAYPHDVFVNPFVFFFAWPDVAGDAAGHVAVKKAAAEVTQAVIDDGQNLDGTVLYPNYSIGDATIESLYGANAPLLKSLRTKYDPTGVFLRTGGFKFV